MRESHGSIGSYIVGFALSLALTIAAYIVVVNHMFDGMLQVTVIIVLALLQVLVQLLFFLHLGQETKPRWKLVIFGFMLLVLGILVFGSLWIMNNLNYHMAPHEVETHVFEEEGIHR